MTKKIFNIKALHPKNHFNIKPIQTKTSANTASKNPIRTKKFLKTMNHVRDIQKQLAEEVRQQPKGEKDSLSGICLSWLDAHAAIAMDQQRHFRQRERRSAKPSKEALPHAKREPYKRRVTMKTSLTRLQKMVG